MYTLTAQEETDFEELTAGLDELLTNFEGEELITVLRLGLAVSEGPEDESRALSTVALYATCKKLGLNPNQVVRDYFFQEYKLKRELEG